jgi:hypothetical protein
MVWAWNDDEKRAPQKYTKSAPRREGLPRFSRTLLPDGETAGKPADFFTIPRGSSGRSGMLSGMV